VILFITPDILVVISPEVLEALPLILNKSMGSPYTNTTRKHGKPTKLQQLVKLTVYLGTVAISLGAIATIASFVRSEDESTAVIERPYAPLSELTQIETFTQAYLTANCNSALLENTQTIRVTGHVVSGDSRQTFSLIKKRPDQMLFTIDHASHEMTFGVSGDTVWRRIRAPQHDDRFALIEGPEAEAWLGQRRFFDRIISTSLGEGRITAIEVTNWTGADCLKVSTLSADGAAVDILVDLQTLYPIVELEPTQEGTIKQTRFSDYRDVDGMLIAFDIVSSIEGEQQSRIIIDKASINSGVLSKLFDVPESLIANE
jgi:hypothetical protein